MKYILYLFYKYYNKGSHKNIAYESAILALITVILFNIFLLLMLFDFMHLLNFLGQKNKYLQYIVFIVTFYIPGYLLFSNLISKRNIQNIELSLKYKKFHSWLLFMYLIVTFILIILKIIERR